MPSRKGGQLLQERGVDEERLEEGRNPPFESNFRDCEGDSSLRALCVFYWGCLLVLHHTHASLFCSSRSIDSAQLPRPKHGIPLSSLPFFRLPASFRATICIKSSSVAILFPSLSNPNRSP